MSEDRYHGACRRAAPCWATRHVDRAEAGKNGFDAAFQKFIVEGAWGTVWAGEAITRASAASSPSRCWRPWAITRTAMHIRRSRNTGATVADIREALLHVAVYAGVPAANRAFATPSRRSPNWTSRLEGRFEMNSFCYPSLPPFSVPSAHFP